MIVAKNDPGQLSHFLLKKGFSRRAVNNCKNHGGMMLVNHHRRNGSYRLKEGDVVHFLMGQEPVNPWLKVSRRPLDIVEETADYLVINKPAGLLSIPSGFHAEDAVINRVLAYFEKQGVNPAYVKPHIVTRLDQDTSGLVLLGKNAIAHDRFSKLSKDAFIKKYHAIVHGNFAEGDLSGLIDKPLARVGDTVKREVNPKGQRALTEYRVLDQVPGASLIELRLLTGRTHQIRIHMASIGHVLYGDDLYGARDAFARQALNCFYLSFPNPFSGEEREIEIPDPGDMQGLWRQLKQEAGK
ncbi:RluA family pseudouridine synthase [uncultured Lactobacillus sp.]|uniref:RluA family pseudouridine synthase n=1 Tax=uncultured Lactobacillus sp. TaxID=153152 RepID=UPI0025940D66|nr:RluA family pseudouridine synthase [uncultured Lactobacillus sp.]